MYIAIYMYVKTSLTFLYTFTARTEDVIKQNPMSTARWM